MSVDQSSVGEMLTGDTIHTNRTRQRAALN